MRISHRPNERARLNYPVFIEIGQLWGWGGSEFPNLHFSTFFQNFCQMMMPVADEVRWKSLAASSFSRRENDILL